MLSDDGLDVRIGFGWGVGGAPLVPPAGSCCS